MTPFYQLAQNYFRKVEVYSQTVANSASEVNSAFKRTTDNQVWSDIDDQVNIWIPNAKQYKTQELNDDIVNLCLPVSSYQDAYPLLAGIPQSWADQAAVQLELKRTKYQGLIDSQVVYNQEYSKEYNNFFIPAFSTMSQKLPSLVVRSPNNQSTFVEFKKAGEDAYQALDNLLFMTQDRQLAFKNILTEANAILEVLKNMVNQINAITWDKTDHCGSDPGAQSITIQAELQELLREVI